MQIPLFPLLNESPLCTGLLFASKACVQIVSSPFFAGVIDRYPKWLLVMIGLFIEIGSLCLFLLQESFGFWLAGRMLSGVAAQFIISSGMAALSEEYRDSPHLRSQAMSLATTGILVGVCSGPLFGGALHDMDEKLPYLVLIAVETIVAVMVFAQYRREEVWAGRFGSSAQQEDEESPAAAVVEQPSSKDLYNKPGEKVFWTKEINDEGAGATPSSSALLARASSSRRESRCSSPGGGDREEEDPGLVSNVRILSTPAALWPLAAVAIANAGISALEATAAFYFRDTFGMEPSEVGAYYMSTSVPSCALVALSSFVARKCGPGSAGMRRALILGTVVQGLGMLVGPKDSLVVEAMSLCLTGMGMGLVDGVTPTLLGDVTDDHFGGTGRIFVLNNAACQLGFVIGPVIGNWVFQIAGYLGFCWVFGGLQVLFGAVWYFSETQRGGRWESTSDKLEDLRTTLL